MQDPETGRSASDLTLLLPWHAAGTLSPAQSRRIDLALDRNSALAHEFANIGCERAEIIAGHESLGAPSPRTLLALFAAIDADAAGEIFR